MAASFTRELHPEALMTIAAEPLREIVRVAHVHRCQSLLLGMSRLDESFDAQPLEELMADVGCNIAVLRAPDGWRVKTTRRIVVPLGGRNQHDPFRARFLGSLQRTGEREIDFLRVMPEHTTDDDVRQAERSLRRFARDEVRGDFDVVIERTNNVVNAIITHADASDLVVLGLPRAGRKRRFFGRIAIELARRTDVAILMLSRSG